MSEHNKGNIIIGILIAFTLYGFLSQYLFASITAGVVLGIILTRLWVPHLPPVLVYLFAYQFLQVFGAILYADFSGQTLEVLFESKDVSYLMIMTLLQLGVMVLFTSQVMKVKRPAGIEDLRLAAEQLDVKKLIIGYAVSAVIFPVLILLSYSASSVSQLVISFAIIKKIFFMMLLFVGFLRKTKYKNAIIFIFFFEFVMSFASYFSNFKEIFVFLIMVYLTVNSSLKSKTIVRILPVVVLLVGLLVFWSSVKVGYRDFLNQGSRQQEISVDKLAALDYIGDRIKSYDLDSFSTGGEILLYRMQYMAQYSIVYNRVPSIIPYANGNNITSTFQFLFAPRALTGTKSTLDPSTKTSYYTGRVYANAEQGTSISMGYFCDLYIDYGIWFMIIPLLMISYLIGKSASYILNYGKYNLIFTYSLFLSVFLSLGTFESDIIFYLGSMRNYAVVLIIGNLLIFPWLNNYVKNRS